MSTKVYLLLETISGNKTDLAEALNGRPGIVTMDVLEGPPDLLVVIEAPERQKAAEHLMGLLDIVDGMVEDLRVLPVRETVEDKAHVY
jgi:hypothetical protein